MKELILALSMMAVSTSSVAQTTHISPDPGVTIPSDQELQATSQLCLGLLIGKIQLQDVLDKLQLKTKEQQQALVTTCLVYGTGFTDGVEAAKQSHNTDGTDPTHTKSIALSQ